MLHLSSTHVVWRDAYISDVLSLGLPFPHNQLADMKSAELERSVKRALRIGSFWQSGRTQPTTAVDFAASSGTGVSDVRFLPGYDGRRIATLSKGIWSVISCWEIPSHKTGEASGSGVRKVAEWCPKGTIITGLVVNSDVHSEAIIATSVNGRRQCIQVLSLDDAEDGSSDLRSLGAIDTSMRPITLQGDRLAYSDDSSRTIITSWRTGALALLQGADEPVDQHFQYNRCLQVVFAHKSVLVVRARSIELFPEPSLKPASECLTYRPLAFHSFGWIDGVSVNAQTHGGDPNDALEPLSILLRAESDDPWMSDMHTLDLYVLEPNSAYVRTEADEDLPGAPSHRLPSPYLFPPKHSTLSSPSVRGFLRCTDVVLGPCGTAIWIQPRPARSADLTTLDVHSSDTQGPRPNAETEVLAGAVFAGSLREESDHGGGEKSVGARTVYVRDSAGSGNWTAMDYVEELGVVALASTQGVVTVLEFG
ncbi:hypothetical protein FOMPIDRAFT_58131 [Fomitopsis schrenkii]|uniref:Uncharacterized protein n=1 Tax=Fomitopsis schrenkii TaxID=2126942 RepID=S8E5M0_FOMSC|nr:hypothetical protein FOMPIDRAFT_58131 [Fomitopsis schrenkii]